MTWDDQIAGYAEERFPPPETDGRLFPLLSHIRESGRVAYRAGATRQRILLRTDDAVERVAQFMWSERAKGTVHPHYPWTGLAPQLRDGLRQHARAAINALLGEEK